MPQRPKRAAARRRNPPRPSRTRARARKALANPARRLAVCSIVVVVVFAMLAFRVTQLQVLSGNRYKVMSLQQTQQTVPLTAQRGTIFDRNGSDLAMSIELTS